REHFKAFGWADVHVQPAQWGPRSLAEIGKADLSAAFADHQFAYGFHLPVTVALDGRDLPGYLIDHHAAHAATAFYAADFDRAAILTHDGHDGAGGMSGLLLYGEGHRILPLVPHYLEAGLHYELVG